MRQLTPQERLEAEKRREREKAAREAEIEIEHSAARALAGKIWNASKPATDHPYLTDKGIKPHGVRHYEGKLILPSATKGRRMAVSDVLIVPMCDVAGTLQNLQLIGRDGTKLFLAGGQRKGVGFAIGSKPKGKCVVLIAEGFSTAATLYEATGCTVVVGFNKDGLEATAKAVRELYPDVHVVVCADDDWKATTNGGLFKGACAANAVNGFVVHPVFENARGEKDTDFNDLAKAEGIGKVTAQIKRFLMNNIYRPNPEARQTRDDISRMVCGNFFANKL